jgi:tetratricopeptide (TPR) repeat protein
VSVSRFLLALCFSAALYAQAMKFDLRHINANDINANDELGPDLPERPEPRPTSDVVSLRELLHPVSKKALRAAYQAQQFSDAHNSSKAIAQLEKAIRIDPSFRDAHCNLGVEYARAGRMADARAEFQKALAIGPPAAPIYADLALASVTAGEFDLAVAFARKALQLDPSDRTAQLILNPDQHQNSTLNSSGAPVPKLLK